LHHARVEVLEGGPVLRRHEIDDAAPHQLFGRSRLQHGDTGRVDLQQPAAGIDDLDALRLHLEDLAAQELAGLEAGLRAPLGGDVAHGPDVAGERARLVELRVGLDDDRPHFPVRATHPEFLVQLPPLRHGRGPCREDALAILLDEDREPGGTEVRRPGIPGQREDVRVDVDDGTRRIGLEDADGRGLHQVPETDLVLEQVSGTGCVRPRAAIATFRPHVAVFLFPLPHRGLRRTMQPDSVHRGLLPAAARRLYRTYHARTVYPRFSSSSVASGDTSPATTSSQARNPASFPRPASPSNSRSESGVHMTWSTGARCTTRLSAVIACRRSSPACSLPMCATLR